MCYFSRAISFFTVGHSTRAIDELVALLAPHGVRRVVDVRTVPRSRTNPQFNRDTLPAALEAAGLGYTHLAELGGLRGRSAGVAPETNGWWENASFHNYADYAMGPAFHAGFERLLELGHEETCAVMCAEALWWRCHRRIVADYLLATGETVLHILSSGKAEPAHLTPAAQVAPGPVITYPA